MKTVATADQAATDAHWMALALEQAQLAQAQGEVPVGAVLVHDGKLVALGRNSPIASQDPSAHAEINALRQAAQLLGNYRLEDCTLYVTLEPCVMCAGAMLHARLRRVVFAACDPKTGAAGSVINVFSQPSLNHQTLVQGGVLSEPCANLLRQFFGQKRLVQGLAGTRLREDALRTPAERFEALPGYPWTGHYLSDLPSLQGLRLHYLDEGPAQAPLTYLCLHGNPAWSYLYRKMIPVFLAAGSRVVAPDLIGFGMSDKPKKAEFHSFSWHRQCLLEFIARLDLRRVVLVVQDWGGLLGLTLPMAEPQRYAGLLVMNTTLATGDVPLTAGFLAWREMCANNPGFNIARLFSRAEPLLSAAECAAYQAPFPNQGYRAALRAFPAMVPQFPDADGAALSRQAREFWRSRWQGRGLMAVGVQDPVLGQEVMRELRSGLRGCAEPLLLNSAGHFVPEQGEPIARSAVSFFANF